MSNIAPYGRTNKELFYKSNCNSTLGGSTSIQIPRVFLSPSHGANLYCINDSHSLTTFYFPLWFFYWQHLTARCYGIPYPALNGAGRQGESRYAKSITPRISNNSNKNSSYNQVILVMTLPIGGEVKWLVIQYGYFKLKDSSSPARGRGTSLPSRCLSTG